MAASGSSAESAEAAGPSTLTKVLLGVGAAAVAATAYVAYSYRQYSNEQEMEKLKLKKPKFKASRSSKAGSSAGSERTASERLAAAANLGARSDASDNGAAAGAGAGKKLKRKGKGSKLDAKLAELPELPVVYKAKTDRTPKPNDLVLRLAQSLQTIRQTKRVSEMDKVLMEYIRQTEVSEYSNAKDRMLAAQFMILFYTLMSLTVSNDTEFNRMVALQKADLPLTWSLLQLPADSKDLGEEERRAADQFLLDIATRMQDGLRLSVVFERIMSRGVNAMSDHEIVGAFATACVVGKWAVFRELGAKLIDRRGPLTHFHIAALQQPTSPDFEQLYNMSESEQKERGDAPVADLRWQAYAVRSLKLKLKHASASDKELLRAIQNDFKAGEADGKEVAVPEQRLIRTGAYVQMLSPSMMPIPLIGPATKNRIALGGYVDLQPAPSKQCEDYVLTLASADEKTKESVWKGTYVMTNEQGSNAVNLQRMQLTFEATMILVEDELEV